MRSIAIGKQSMNKEIEFYKLVDQDKIRISELGNQSEMVRAAVKANKVIDLARAMEMKNFPANKIQPDDMFSSETIYVTQAVIEDYLHQIYVKNLAELNTSLRKKSVFLDETWRGKVSSYISHIRSQVEKAEIEQRLRQLIMNKLNELQAAVDRNEARVDSAIEIFLDLTEAAGEGAKNLKPAIGVGKKLWLSLKKLKQKEVEEEPQRRLPAPEELGLEDLSEQDKE